MTRDEAIETLAKHALATMSPEERKVWLEELWSIDEEDSEWYALPKTIRMDISNSEEPVNYMESRYNPFILTAVRDSFFGLRNEYLKARLEQIGISVNVVGHVEMLERCPCCGYRTLNERGQYFICPVCFWEDTGSDDIDQYSGPNHMTLREGRENFQKIGACDEAMLEHVVQNGKDLYIYDDTLKTSRISENDK